jgi:hypothetical protein
MRAFDTTPEAERAHLAALRRMGGDRRAALAVALSKQAAETALAGIRARNPQLSEEEARRILFERIWGAALFASAIKVSREC